MYQSAETLYERGVEERWQYINRAEDSAKFTIPALMPPQHGNGDVKHNRLYQPYQSLGSRGVNALSANLLISLLPPNQSFFRLVIDDAAIAKLGGPEIQSEVEASLSQIERIVQKEVEIMAFRPVIHEALRLLVVTGNALIHMDKDGDLRCFRLDNYIIRRRPNGKTDTIVLKEQVYLDALSEEMQTLLIPEVGGGHKEKTVDLFTCVHWDPSKKKFHTYQMIKNILVPGSEATYPEKEVPFLALRFTRVQGENYGRSFVEEHIGDIRSLEGLSQAILEASAASAKALFLVNPNGTTKAKVLAESGNGAIVQGNAADVTTLQVGKAADLSVAFQTINLIKERLGKAFLITSDLFRDAERVTATEIQAVIRQVEKSLGGLYSLLSNEFQLPLINLILKSLSRRRKIPKLPKEVSPTIVVGMDAIGRAAELEKLDMLLTGLGQLFGPEALAQVVNVNEYLTRRAASLGVNTAGLIKTEEELMAEQQAQMAQMAAQQVAAQGTEAVINQATQAPQQPPQQ